MALNRPGPATRAEAPILADRRAKLVQMRARKIPWQQIADDLGYAGPAAAAADLKRVLAQRKAELDFSIDDYRELELENLEDLERKIRDGIESLEVDNLDALLPAMDRLLRLSKRRADLIGLDAVKKVEFDGNVKSYNYQVNGVDVDALR